MRLEEAVGIVLRRRREERRLSQDEFADKAKIARTYVSIVERGESSPTLDKMTKACSVYGIDVSVVIIEAERLMRNAEQTQKDNDGEPPPDAPNK